MAERLAWRSARELVGLDRICVGLHCWFDYLDGASPMRGFVDGEYQDGELRGITFLAGVRGSGKTTEMVRLLDSCSGGIIFFDSLSKHEGVLRKAVIISQPGQLKTYLRRYNRTRFRILYQPRTGNLDEHFESVCRIVMAFGWMIFGIDELDKLCGNRFAPTSMPPGLYELVNYGRHHRVSMLATARTPIQVPRGFTSESCQMRLFRMHENRYVKYFEEFIGTANADRLPKLEKFRFLLWRDGDEIAELCGGRR
jgi:hypothetical protein